MNKKIVIIFISTILFGCCEPPLYEQQRFIDLYSQSIFPKGNKITDNIIGSGWLQMLVNNDTIFNTSISNITFETKARTNWHRIPGSQIILVTSGKGYYQERGKPVKLIKKGDVVKIAQDVEHWYGATACIGLTYIAISTNVLKGIVE